VPIDGTDPSFYNQGIINVRIDSQSVVSGTGAGGPYLLPIPQNNNDLNLDTIVGVVANDGHTGKTLASWPVTIIFAPTILTNTLPNAKEGVDYSLNFQDPNLINRIQIQNLNPEHPLIYHLIYGGQKEAWYRDHPNKVPAPSSYDPTVGPSTPLRKPLAALPIRSLAPRQTGLRSILTQVCSRVFLAILTRRDSLAHAADRILLRS